MPMDFDTGDMFARHARDRPGYQSMTEFNQNNEIIIQFKLTLIGNTELKKRLLNDDKFPGWFRDHLQDCVDALAAIDVMADSHWLDLTLLQENMGINSLGIPATGGTGFDGSEPSNMEKNNRIFDPLVDLKNAIIVLRLLLTTPETQLERPATPKTSGSQSSLEACVPVLLSFITHVSDVIFPNLAATLLSQKWCYVWKSLSPVLFDTIHAILLFTESSKLAFSSSCLPVLWAFLSGLFSQFTVAEDAPQLLAPVVLEAYNILPFLLELDSTERKNPDYNAANLFLSQNIRHLDFQMDRMFSFFSQNMSNFSDEALQVSPTVLLDMRMVQNSLDFLVLSAVTLAIAQIVNFIKDGSSLNPNATQAAFLASPKFHQCLLMFFYAENHYVLSVAALNLFQFRLSHLPHYSTHQEDISFSTFEKMFPRVIELLSYQQSTVSQTPGYLQLPVTVLSDLCLKYPQFSSQLNNTGVDKKIMGELSKLLDSSVVFSFLQTAKGLFSKTKNAIDFSALRRKSFGISNVLFSSQKSELNLIASHLLLLSVFTSSNEDFRRKIASYAPENESKLDPNFLCLAFFEIVENYEFLSTQLILNYKMFSKLQEVPQTSASEKLLEWLSENVTVLLSLLEHPVNKNAFYLMRSLSRSVSTMRTFFVDSNSIKSSFEVCDTELSNGLSMEGTVKTKSVLENIKNRYDRESHSGKRRNFISYFLKIISRMANVDAKVMFFASAKLGLVETQYLTRKTLSEKNVVILAILANLILDFSSFRYEIVHHERILKDLANLFKISIQKISQLELEDKTQKEVKEVIYEQLKLQTSILQVVKNYLYNENEDNRKVVWEYIPLSLIFELSLYGGSGVVEVDWDLHRLRIEEKVLSFEILRNLTAASFYFSESINKLYMEFAANHDTGGNCPRSWNKYLLDNLLSFGLFMELNNLKYDGHRMFLEDDEFVLRLLKDPEYVRLIVAINYLEDHRFTNIRSFCVSDFPHKALLKVWKRLLEITVLKSLELKICGSDLSACIKLSNQINEVKVSIAWILINLTWDEEDIPHGPSFSHMDMILTRYNDISARDPSSYNASQIVVDVSEDDEDESLSASTGARSFRVLSRNSLLSMKMRAKLIYQAGFCKVLEKITNELSSPHPILEDEKEFSMERFDSLSSSDLFEKCKTAQLKILLLISRKEESGFDDSLHVERDEPHVVGRTSNLSSARESNIRPDVNRGGEGFGYSSDEDYGNDGPTRLQPAETRNEEGDESEEMVEDEEFDEYWIR